MCEITHKLQSQPGDYKIYSDETGRNKTLILM